MGSYTVVADYETRRESHSMRADRLRVKDELGQVVYDSEPAPPKVGLERLKEIREQLAAISDEFRQDLTGPLADLKLYTYGPRPYSLIQDLVTTVEQIIKAIEKPRRYQVTKTWTVEAQDEYEARRTATLYGPDNISVEPVS